MKLLRKLQISCICLLFAGGVAAFLQSQWLPDGSEPGLVWDSEGGFAGPEYFDDDKLVFRLITAGTFAIPDEDSNYAIINAFQTWEDVENAEIAFSRGTNVTVDTPVESANEHFTIGFTDAVGNTQWGGNLGGATGLATTSFFLTTPKQVSDADIAFRASATFSNDGSTATDLEATALHEVGHALGVAHSPHAQSEMSYVGSWIGTCQCNTGGRTLTEDDKLAISLIYPVDGYLATVGTISGTITKTSDSSNVHMAQIGLFDSNDVLITTSLSDSGTYKIEGVPPGTYTLRAFPTLNSAENDNLHQSWESLSSLFLSNGAPTDFITTASDDAAGVVVSANTTTSQNLTVADGNSSMTCRFSNFKNDSTTLARTQGIRLKRGQAETVGLIGANMPSVGTLDELSILGGGLEISNFKDEANGAPNFSGETIIWDLSVDADANFGSRALVLRNSAHPTERYLIFGYLEVYDEGSAAAAAGTENPADSGLWIGQSNVIMNQFTIAAGAEEDLRVREWEITNVGTGSSGNVTEVKLNYDDDGNGQVDPDDTEIGAGTFAGSITFRSAYTIPAGAAHDFLISYTFNGSESDDDTFLAQLSNMVVSGMDSSKTLAETGLPVNGGTMTIDAVAPTVDSVSADKANGAYGPGEVISVEVVFSEDVIVSGTPQLTLETGGMDAVVDYTGASSGSTLTFDYTVGTGDVNTDLDYISTAALALNSGTIRDSAGNTAVLTLAAPGAAGSLGAAKDLDIGLPVVDFTAAGQSTDETTVSVTVTATLDRTTSQSVSVPFSIAGGSTAVDPDDYTVATASPLTIAAGNTSATITINPNDDVLDEADEMVIVNMGTPVNASQGTTVTHTLTINDDDATPTVAFTAASQEVSESAGGLTITAQLSAVSGRNVSVPFAVNVAATATVTNDYTITDSPINIAAGQSSQDIAVTVVDDGDTESSETVVVDMGAPTNADQGATTTHTVTIIDNDTVGFTLAESSGSTVVAENGGTDTFEVVLDVEPGSDVVLTVTSQAEADAMVDKATLTFTAGDWDTGQTVTVTGVNDDFDRDDATTVTLAVDDGSSDDAFDALADQDVAVACTDDDTAGFTVTESSGATVVAENGGADTFDVVLDAQPESDVVLTVTSNSEVDATADKATLTFTTGNWDTGQTVTVTGVDDDFDRDDTTSVTLAVDDGSSDDVFDALADQNVAVTCTDDDTAGFTVTESAGATVVAENAGTDTFDVVLNARPESDVVLTVASNVEAEATVDKAALTFTIGNWDTGQTVTVTGIDDDFDRDDATTVTLAVDDGSSDDVFDAVADQDVAVTCTDDDTAGFTVTESSGSTVVAEDGGTDTFDVVLDAQPESDVALTVTSLAEADATVDKSTLTFTTGNWDMGQTVTITGVVDNFDRDDTTTVTLAVDDGSSDDVFDVLADQDVAVTCTDDDTAGFTVTESSGSTVVAEDGGTDTFDVVLDAQPESDVALTVISGAVAEATVNKATLTFTTGNWDMGQTVTITGVDDDFDRDDATTISLAVDDGSSNDIFDAVADQNVAVTCTDDDTAGFTVTESSGSTVVAESAGSDTFDVVLDAQPESDVVLTVTSNSEAEATVDKATLTFTTGNWDTGQTVTVTGVDDDFDRADSTTISLAVDDGSSNDIFDAVADQNVAVTCTDDDTAGFTVTESVGSTVVAENAGTDTFDVVLDAQPESDVVLTVTSDSAADAVVDKASLTFTTVNWDTGQTVTVTGADDYFDRDDVTTVTLAVNDGSSDDAFDTVADQDVAVTCTDDDTAGFTFTESSGSTVVAESGGTDTFDVVLDARPESDVVLTVASSDADEATVDAATVTFTTASWDMPQEVTVTGVDDDFNRADTTTISIAVDGASSFDAFDAVADQDVTVTCMDDDTAGFAVTESAASTVVAEGGGADTFSVVLEAQPESDVVLTVTSNSEAEATVDKATLTFTAVNWEAGQTVTVTGVDDDFDRDDATTVTVAVDDDNSDDVFDALADQDVAVTCTDDDTAGFTITETSGSTAVAEDGGTDTFSVVLDVQPDSAVVLSVSSLAETETTVDKTTLTFTAGNWDTGQTVTVTGVNDDFDRDDATAVRLAVDDGSSDDAFDSLADQDVAVACTDDDTAGFTVTESSGSTVVAESAGTDSFDVVLDAQPESDVVLTVNSGSVADATVDKATLTFTTGNWDTGQLVTVTSVDDDFDRDDTTTVTVSVDDGSSFDAFDALADQDVAVTCTDDDTAGFTATESAGATVVAENAGDDTFDVVLDARPEFDVVLTVTSNSEADVTVDMAMLTFSTGNWDTVQTVTVTGIDDDFDRDDTTTVTLAVDDDGSADAFDAVADQDVAVTCTDDDTAGFTATESAGATVVAENAGADTFDVVLNAQPESDVVITVSSLAEADATVDKATLTFTTGNWDTGQTVTVTGVDDDFDRDDTTTVTLAVDDGSSFDTFDAVADQNVAVTCTDDDTAGFTVSESAGSTVVAEGGGADTFDVVLDAQPESDVILTVSSLIEADVTVDKATLTFTTGNWDTGQTVTVTGVDDDFDRDDATTVTVAVDDDNSDDAFDGLADQDVAVSCTDDDTAGFTITESDGTTSVAESAGTDTFDVVLDAQPESDVVLTIASSDTDEVTVGFATLTFAPGAWDSAQTVTVTGVDDDFDRDDATTVSLSVAEDSLDDAFDALADQDVSVTCTDDDTAGFTITESDGTTAVAENGGTDTFEVVLDARPESDVVVLTIASSDTDEATVDVATLTFTPGTWDSARTVTVTGVDDIFSSSTDSAEIALDVDVAASNDAFDHLPTQTVGVTIQNDDIVFLSIADVAILEAAGEVQFTVTLSMASAQTVSVAYGLHDGTARSGSDYVAVGPLNIEIPAGQMAGTIEVQIVADDIYEQDEQFVLQLTSPLAAELATATATATINDDELRPSLAVATATVGESDGSVAVTITLTGRAEDVVSVNLVTVPGTALAAEDYESHDSVVTWASTETGDKTVEIQIVADDIYEQDEQFVLELTSPVAAELGTATATATINDDELIPTLAVATATVGESDGSVAVTITLTGRAEAVVSVNLATVPGTALAAEDYESYDSVVTWASTETGDKTVNVDIVNDPEPEDPESFDVQLSAEVNADIAHATAAVTINDDDGPPNFMLTLNFSGSVANSSLVFGQNGAAAVGHDGLDVVSPVSSAAIDNYLASGDDHFQLEMHPQAASGHWMVVVDVPLADETTMSWEFAGITLPGAIYLHEVSDTISIDAGIDMLTTTEIPAIASPRTFQISLGPVVNEDVTVAPEWTMLGLPVISGKTMGEVFDVGRDGELAEPTWRWDPYDDRFILVSPNDPAVPETGYFVYGGAEERAVEVSGVEPDGIVQTVAGWQVLSPVHVVTALSLLEAGVQVIWELSRTTGTIEAVSPAAELQPGVGYWIYCTESVEIDLRGD